MTEQYLRILRLLALRGTVLLAIIQLSNGIVLSLDSKKALTQYICNKWEVEDGLPQNTVNAIIQSRDSYIWVGTHSGLARFDGVRFTIFDKENTDGINNNNVMALAEDREGALWFGTSGGLTRLSHGKFTTYTTNEGLPHNQIYSIYEDKAGNLWVGTGGGLSRFRDGKFTNFTTQEGLSHNIARSIFEDREGSLWIGTEGGGLNRFRNGAFTVYTVKSGLSSDIILSICEDSGGSLWVGTYGGGLNRLRNGIFTSQAVFKGASNNSVYALLEDRAGNLWVGTDSRGLNRMDGGKLSAYAVKDGLSDALVRAIYEDREGNLWVGARGGGLNRLRDGKFTNFTTKEGLSNDDIFPIYEDSHGNVWIGTNGGGLNRFKDGKFSTYTTKDGLANNLVWSIHEDTEGSLWVGTENGLSRLRDGKFSVFTTKDGLTSNIVWAINSDHEKNLWIGTNRGLNRLKDGKITAFTVEDGLSDPGVRYIHEDHERNLWVATNKGLSKWKDGKFIVYTMKDGLPQDQIKCIYEDQDGSLWIGTNGGLSRFKNNVFTSFGKKDGLIDGAVYQILDDLNGNLWITSSRGPFRVRKQELEDFAQGKIRSFASGVYTKADGLVSTQCNSGAQPMGYRTKDGRLWFPTAKGVAVIDPNNIKLNSLIPPILIERVISNKRSLDLGQSPVLPPGQERIEFHYASLSFTAPENVRFRYKLEGLDKDWIEAGGRRIAYYTNLPPGVYHFRVTASNNDGLWNEVGAAFTFSLQPHFYQTKWFYGLCICTSGFLILGGYRIRVRSLEVREQRLTQLVNDRTMELQDQRGFLRKVIDLNPSFIFAKDKQGRFTLANRALAEAFGDSVEALIGKTNAELNVPQREAERFEQDDQEVIESKIEKLIPEVEFTDKNGDLHWLQIIKIPIVSPDGKADQLLGVASDITLQKQAANEMRKAKEVAEAATRAKSEFLANMSHEIRTPMNAVIGMTDLLLDTPLANDQKEFVETIRTGGDSLLTIINDILDFSKIESGHLDLERAPFNLRTCVEEALDLLAAKADEKELEFAYLIDEDTPQIILGDITRLRQVLVNLLSNAIKFTQHGEVVVSISASLCASESTELHFAVRDTGIGIPADKIELLFRSFSQVDSSTTRIYGGTGLGLVISKRLVEIMGGRMWVESEQGSGSTFHFTIAVDAASAERCDEDKQDLWLAGQRVLIVEENNTNREILTRQTRSWGMEPKAVASGREALELLARDEHFSLALIDLHLPGLDVLTLAAEIRRHVDSWELPLVLISSGMTTRRDMLSRNERQMFAGFLAKPIKSLQLYSLLVEVLSGMRSVGSLLTESRFDGDLTNQASLRVLLVEDNLINQKVALMLLNRLGYQADVADNGIEALSALRRQVYDVVLMDVQMPELDGLETTREICRNWPETRRPWIIALTANAMQEDREKALDAGMNDYITKPVHMKGLKESLDRARIELEAKVATATK